MRRALATLLLLLLLVPAGCGGSGSSGSSDLRITVWGHGKSGGSVTYTLTCPQGTEIYGGAQVAHVSGRFAGKKIDADFNRTNGCEIERWSRLAFLLPSSFHLAP